LPTLPEGSIRCEHVWKRFRADAALPLFYEQLRLFTKTVMRAEERRKYRWVLKDINLEIEPGSTTALIGINGSGKTTLLKVLSQVTYQSAGTVTTAGRIGALLSVTSGLHPDLTGKENTFLYGAVLGMSRARIRERFDEIVEFAGLTEAVNRQVKFYSVGMLVRLGFSIAAFLEPEILLVDEVLAVGDANFQQKCLQRINEIVQSGTTLLFVSHDLASVEASCDRAIWLADAVVRADGPTKEVLKHYRGAIEQNAMLTTSNEGDVRIVKVELEAADGGQIRSECDVDVRVTLHAPKARHANFYLGVSQGTAFPMFVVHHDGFYPEGEFEITCRLSHLPLPKGRYSLWTAMTGAFAGRGKPFIPWKPAMHFDAFGPDPLRAPEGVMIMTPIYVRADWQVN
jgi:ABC-type polysaccharide/polyol phosphate transport system ATPase subunit